MTIFVVWVYLFIFKPAVHFGILSWIYLQLYPGNYHVKKITPNLPQCSEVKKQGTCVCLMKGSLASNQQEQLAFGGQRYMCILGGNLWS